MPAGLLGDDFAAPTSSFTFQTSIVVVGQQPSCDDFPRTGCCCSGGFKPKFAAEFAIGSESVVEPIIEGAAVKPAKTPTVYIVVCSRLGVA